MNLSLVNMCYYDQQHIRIFSVNSVSIACTPNVGTCISV